VEPVERRESDPERMLGLTVGVLFVVGRGPRAGLDPADKLNGGGAIEQMTTANPTPPGWYPVEGGMIRYWDGVAWQGNPVPPTQSPEPVVHSTAWVIGIIGAYFFPLVSLGVSIHLFAKGHVAHGFAMLLISCVGGIASLMFWVSMAGAA
jgi:hypothetical protein